MQIDRIPGSQGTGGITPLRDGASKPSATGGDEPSPRGAGDSFTPASPQPAGEKPHRVRNRKAAEDKAPVHAPPSPPAKAAPPPPTAIATLEEPSLVSRVESAVSSAVHRVMEYLTGAHGISYYRDITASINALEPQVASLSDRELQAKTGEFKARIAALEAAGKTREEALGEIMPEAYAVMREADKRVLNMRPFDEQVMAGVACYEGAIVEQKTGEGKTLMETLPVYLNAIAGKGVHVVTANEYLASRDAEWMGKALQFMGISVGVIKQDMTTEERIAANRADVTYGTNDEFGFQYLRDNLTHDRETRVGRDLKEVFALVDEVDSILIDEARTPLIISRQSGGEQPPYELFSEMARYLAEGKDYAVDRKNHSTVLTEAGTAHVEKMLGVDNLYGEDNLHMVSFVRNAVTAKALYRNNVDYVVKNGEVVIVDEFTGRLQPGRRYSEGLHEAIEAREGVPVRPGTETLAMITYQNYFKLYGRLAGMTGTAQTASQEFGEVFGKNVVVIPTHKPVARQDLPDLIYKTEREKFNAIADNIVSLHRRGQPVLIGTRSIERSELLSALLKERGIPHQVLNAKNHTDEAAIIAQAGRPGMVTVATNMAGRGVDIRLGGDPEKLALEESRGGKISYADALAKFKGVCDEAKEQVKGLGGLAVIGSERHEDRRVDDQLRGRAGRQGDPGVSQFYVSLEDELMRLFGGDKVKRLAEKLGFPNGEPIKNGFAAKAVEVAQKRCEERNLDIRKNLMRYDGVLNRQREVVYEDRDAVIGGSDLGTTVKDMMARAIEFIVEKHQEGAGKVTAGTQAAIDKDVAFLLDIQGSALDGRQFTKAQDLTKHCTDKALELYHRREEQFGREAMSAVLKDVFLSILDEGWITQQTALRDLREGIWLRGYGQEDPDLAYFKEAHTLFEEMKDGVATETVRSLFHIPPRLFQLRK
ncbi:MAG: preprotein translocase subunit SecA [Candidatus Eremiobacteraeota bacterium]|nr:preprotein translocase subunit SecA [Candidatus Eremiobacteraeota bacterium]